MLKKQIIHFVLVGILNTIVGYSLYAIFLYIGFDYKLSLLLATILGVLFNFKSIGKLVFKSNDNSLLVRFIFVYIVVFLVNLLIIKIFKQFEFNDYYAGAFALIPAAIISFVLNKYLVFKR